MNDFFFSSWMFCFSASVILSSRCRWEVLLWLLFSYQAVSSRSRGWSSLRSLRWFSPRRCKLLKLVQIDNQSIASAQSLLWLLFFQTSSCLGVDDSDLCFVQAAATDSEDSQDSSDSGVSAQKTREILARRPSYRWVTCGLSPAVTVKWNPDSVSLFLTLQKNPQRTFIWGSDSHRGEGKQPGFCRHHSAALHHPDLPDQRRTVLYVSLLFYDSINSALAPPTGLSSQLKCLL